MGIYSHLLWANFFKKKSIQKTLIHSLRENILFNTLSPRELAYVATLLYERTYQPEEIIFKQNDRGTGIYLILEGRVAIQTHHSRGNIVVTYLDEGSLFGEIALVVPNSSRTASAVAVQKSKIVGFFKPDLMKLIECKPSTGVKLLLQLSTILGTRLLETTGKITQLELTQSQLHRNKVCSNCSK